MDEFLTFSETQSNNGESEVSKFMANIINHSVLNMKDDKGNEQLIYPQNDGTDVSLDTSSNKSIPTNVTNVQELANKMGGAAFMDSSEITTLQDDVSTLQTQTNGIVVSVPSTGWSQSGAFYVQTLSVSGITGNETVSASLYDTGSLTDAEITAFDEIITKIETRTNQIVLYAADKPTVSFYIILSGILSINNQGLSNLSDIQRNIDKLDSRVSNLYTIKDGSTTADAELIDIRVKADGTTARSAGDAVREQVTELNKKIDVLYDNDASIY